MGPNEIIEEPLARSIAARRTLREMQDYDTDQLREFALRLTQKIVTLTRRYDAYREANRAAEAAERRLGRAEGLIGGIALSVALTLAVVLLF